MNDPHGETQMLRAGTALENAELAVVLLHGRGGSAEDILTLAPELGYDETAYVAPQAAGHTWYPQSFLAPREENEPWLSSALAKVSAAVSLCTKAGVPVDRIVLAGFSQGACLATEFVASAPAGYGGLIALTGGLIGPPDTDLRHHGSLRGLTALLSSGDPDPHVPWSRVEASARELERMGAAVELRRHPGRPHTILDEEIRTARRLLEILRAG